MRLGAYFALLQIGSEATVFKSFFGFCACPKKTCEMTVFIDEGMLEISAMIELKGLYYNNSKKSPMAVLVQYDGQFLHVWHLTDPFFRLRSSSRFVVKHTNKKGGKIIKFPDGAYIESENENALNELMEKITSSCASRRWAPCKKGTLLFITFLILLLIGAGWSIII